MHWAGEVTPGWSVPCTAGVVETNTAGWEGGWTHCALMGGEGTAGVEALCTAGWEAMSTAGDGSNK